MRILIAGGTVVNADGTSLCDVLIEDGRIVSVQEKIDCPDAERVDAAGKLVFPGFIDTHTHFDLVAGGVRTADNFASGTAAAVLGGTTTVIDFATQERGESMREALQNWHEKAKDASCNYGFHMAVSEWNAARLAELDDLIAAGVTSYKMYMVYDNMRVSDGDIYEALIETAKRGCLIGVHCENYDVLQKRIADLHASGRFDMAAHPVSRPADVEAEAVARLMRIASLANAPVYVVHLSTEEGLNEALRARSRVEQVE